MIIVIIFHNLKTDYENWRKIMIIMVFKEHTMIIFQEKT